MSKQRNRNKPPTEDLLGALSDNEVVTTDSALTTDLESGKKTASAFADALFDTAIGHDDPFAKITSREKITYKTIDSIYPNRTQPRRAIPSSVRIYFTGSDFDAMEHGFQLWLKAIEVERKSPFPLDDYLEATETGRTAGIEQVDEELEQTGSTPKMGPLESALMKVVELASSIKRDGLTNPISVAALGRDYEIETGERRWLAYHLLNWKYPDGNWAKIPSRQVDGGVSIWRQANENNIRADLNAIAMARQFALLLMDILGAENFESFDNFGQDREQDFYAQVADGTVHRVPRNQGEKLLNAMNLENAVQLRQYRALLRLPRDVWQWADDLNWTEGFIRKVILSNGETDDDKLRIAYKQARSEGYTVTDDTVYEMLLKATEPKQQSQKSKYTHKHFSKTLGEKVKSYLTKLSGKDRENTIAYLREMLETLEKQ